MEASPLSDSPLVSLVLKRRGVLTPYLSPSAEDIPEQFKDKEDYWTGFAARARVIIYNKELVSEEEAPKSILDFTKSEWQGEVAIANPLFGTTATHAAALFVELGEEKARHYFESLKENKAVVVESNSVVRDQVAEGELKVGLTDTDDANGAIEDGKPIGIVYPDEDGIGTLIIPNSVALINGGPNSENGKRFIDYLLTREVEEKLAHSRAAQIPVRPGVKAPENVISLTSIKAMPIDFEDIADQMENTAIYIRDTFLR